MGNGKSNLTYLVEDGGGARWILRRRPPVGPRLATAHDVAREHRILRALEPTAVPTPAVLGFTDDPAVSDAPLLLMEHVDGVVLDDVGVAIRLGSAGRARLSEACVRALARVHEVDLRATGLEDLSSHAPYAARQLKRWRRQWEASRTRELPAVERLADRLEAAVPEQRELTLVHGDFHLLNVVAAPGGEDDPRDPRLGAVHARRPAGRPRRAARLLAAGRRRRRLGVPRPGAFAGFASPAQLAELYAAQTGRDLAALPFWHALGLWKVAIICEGVRRRALEDERNAARTGIPAERAVEDLLARAEAVLFGAGL